MTQLSGAYTLNDKINNLKEIYKYRMNKQTRVFFLHQQCARSPSPMRAISLDARCCSPASTDVSDLRTPSPSQNSLVSLISGGTGTSCISPKLNRCLSPLLIPPRTPAGVDPGIGPASPLGALQLDLYTRQEGPMYITAPENITPLGRLHLRIKYDSQVSDLAVHLIEGNVCVCLYLY